MAGEWPQQALEEVAELSGGFAFKSEDYSADGRFVLRTLNIKDDGSIHRDDAVFLPLEKCDLYKRFELQEHDTLFVMVGAKLGKVGYVRRETLPALLNQNMWRIRGRDGLCDKRYLQYAFRHTVVKNLGWASGSARDFVRRDDYRTMEIPVPPLAEQKAIAAVLGALDDKIELNRRMNATLEAMARALFQSWFVDFDPVRAKLDGRPPAALDPATAALFPGSFVETELGHIPHGWTPGNFGEVIAAERERIGASDAVVLSAVASSQLVRSDEHFNKQVYSKSISNYLKVRQWDFAYNPSRINIGSIGMLKESVIGAVSPVYEVFRPKAAYHWFVERSLAQPDTKVWIQTLCSGSVRQSLKLRDLESIPLVVPPAPIVQAFNKTWEQWHDLIQANERESRTLATLRDTLLPKLLSGEIIPQPI